MYKKLKYYFKLWLVLTRNAFLQNLMARLGIVIFFTGKILRFTVFFVFLYFLVKGNQNLAGYTLDQTIFIFLTFTLVDVLAQFFYRGVYSFRPKVVSGEFDLILSKPGSALFRSLTGGTDIIDLLTIPPLLCLIYLFTAKLNPSLPNTFLYLLLIANSLLIATAFHIFTLALGIITLVVDHTIMFYRDLVNLGKLPIEVYRQPIRSFLTFLIPVGIMVTIPAKTLMGLTSLWVLLISFLLGIILITVSLKFWQYALKFYTSASS